MPLLDRIVVALTMFFCAGAVHAQIIYEPVQYQYGEQNKFYYGGSDPDVIARAQAPRDAGGEWGRVHGYAFVSGDFSVHREVTNEPVRIYSDAIPFQNAALYGYTVTDAHNAAYASIPRYFRKADFIAAAKESRGMLIVPAQAQTPSRSAVATPTTTVKSQSLPLMVLPKPPLQPATRPSDKLADVSAQSP